MKNELKHLGLGNLPAVVGLTKSNLMHSAKLGVGAAAGITLTNLLLSKVLVKNGQPLVPLKWSPLAVALGGIALGALTKKFGAKLLRGTATDVGDGMIAGTVGQAAFDLFNTYVTPAAAAQNAAAALAEGAGAGAQAGTAGTGRAFASGLAGVKQLAGATVAFEDVGPMSGATVAFEDVNGVGSFVQ